MRITVKDRNFVSVRTQDEIIVRTQLLGWDSEFFILVRGSEASEQTHSGESKSNLTSDLPYLVV